MKVYDEIVKKVWKNGKVVFERRGRIIALDKGIVSVFWFDTDRVQHIKEDTLAPAA